MAKKNTEKKSIYKKWWFWVIMGIVVFIGIASAYGSKKTGDNEDAYNDALRKCTVMEGIDIYVLKNDTENKNAFDKAKETCFSDFYNGIYKGDKEKFITNTNLAWDEVKDEEVEGHPYSYYLEILGW